MTTLHTRDSPSTLHLTPHSSPEQACTGHMVMSGYIFALTPKRLITPKREDNKDPVENLQSTRKFLVTKNYLLKNANSAKIEKPWS